MVKEISGADAECQIVAVISGAAAKHAAHASASTEAAKAPVIVTSAPTASASAGCSFHYGTKTDGLAYTQVHRDIGRSLSEVDRDRVI